MASCCASWLRHCRRSSGKVTEACLPLATARYRVTRRWQQSSMITVTVNTLIWQPDLTWKCSWSDFMYVNDLTEEWSWEGSHHSGSILLDHLDWQLLWSQLFQQFSCVIREECEVQTAMFDICFLYFHVKGTPRTFCSAPEGGRLFMLEDSISKPRLATVARRGGRHWENLTLVLHKETRSLGELKKRKQTIHRLV